MFERNTHRASEVQYEIESKNIVRLCVSEKEKNEIFSFLKLHTKKRKRKKDKLVEFFSSF